MMMTLSVARIRKGEKPSAKIRPARLTFRFFEMKRDAHFPASQHAEHEDAGGELRQHGCDGSAGDIHVEQENENRIQNDIDDGADERGHHAQHGMALRGDKILHPHGKQGEKGAAGINGQIGIRIGEGSITRSEPAKQQILGRRNRTVSTADRMSSRLKQLPRMRSASFLSP